MLEKLKNVGWGVAGLAFFVAIALLVALFIHGGAWLGERIYPWLVGISSIALTVLIFVLLPLSFFRTTRAFAGNWMIIASWVFGVTLWVWGLILTYHLWGALAVYIGLFLFGVGIVPMAMLATMFKGMWSTFGELVFLIILTFGSRLAGGFVLTKAE